MAVKKPKTIKVDTPLSKYVTSGKRSRTTKIAWHYTGAHDVSAKSTALNWFLPIAQGKHPKTFASAHFVVGLEGEIYEMIPLNYVAYTTNSANSYSIGVECATTGKNDHYSDKEYASMVKLGAWLAQYYDLDPRKDFIRHYDVTRKVCPRYFVNNATKWNQFKIDCYNYMKGKLKESNIRNCTNGKGNSILTSTNNNTDNNTVFKQYYVRVVTDKLNARDKAGTDGKIVDVLTKGTAVTIVKEQVLSNGAKWGKTKSGYWINIGKKYVEFIRYAVPTFKQYYVKVVVSSLNGREGAGTSYEVEQTLKKDEVVTIVEEKILDNGVKWGKTKSGYWINISEKYVKFLRYVD